jgi:hypothetical protein
MSLSKYVIAAAAAIFAGWASAAVADTTVPRFIVVRPGEAPKAAWRRALLADALARHGITALPGPGAHPATTAPTIISGKLVTTKLATTAQPAAPKLTFKYATPGLFDYAYFEFESPAGQILFASYSAALPSSTSGTVTFEDPLATLSLYAEPGKWILSYAAIVDGSLNYTEYNATQLASLFPSVTLDVTNSGVVDYTPPTVTAGKIKTKKVSLKSTYAYFEADLTVTDDTSGVAFPIVFISPPGSDFGLSYDDLPPIPKLKGTFLSATPVTAFSPTPTGAWTIVGYGAADAALNYFEDTNPTDVQKLFGTTTFEVTD